MATEKITEAYTQRFTASEMLDLNDLAMREERTVPEVVRFIIRRYLYGNSRRPADERNGTNSGFQRLQEP